MIFYLLLSDEFPGLFELYGPVGKNLFVTLGIIIYHDFLPTPMRGTRVKSGKTHTVIKMHPLAHILDS